MEWSIYRQKILDAGASQGKSDQYIKEYLNYVKPLFDAGLPIITSPEHLALLVGVDYEYLCRMAYSQRRFYRHFTIKKKNGKNRDIDEPLPDLKAVQRWILDEILTHLDVSQYSKAYIRDRSIKDNARFHRAQMSVVTMDIKDFFPSIWYKDIFLTFSMCGYKNNVASFLANLCCLDGKLPQGAPTSPCLSNLVMRDIDTEIAAYCRKHQWRYTRYADDLTFSGEIDIARLIRSVTDTVEQRRFKINREKTRVAGRNARQAVTGIVVNHHMQVPRETRMYLRQQVYYIRKFGLDSHLSHIQETRKNYVRHLLGVANHALYVNPNDPHIKDIVIFLKQLLKISAL